MAIAAVKEAYKLSVNFFDTAPFYGSGKAEMVTLRDCHTPCGDFFPVLIVRFMTATMLPVTLIRCLLHNAWANAHWLGTSPATRSDALI